MNWQHLRPILSYFSKILIPVSLTVELSSNLSEMF